MPPRIGVIVSGGWIGDRILEVAASNGWDGEILVREGVRDVAHTHAKELERMDVDVIIARGINAEIVRDTVETPVVEIPVSGQDLATALHEAKKLTRIERPRIGLLAYSQAKRDALVFSELLDIDLRIYPVVNDDDFIRTQIISAKKDGVHVLVGGKMTSLVAQEQGMQTLMLDSGEVSLRTALHEARMVAYARRLEKVRTRRLQAVADISSSGIFVLDVDGRIQAINATARSVLRIESELGGAKAADALPEVLKRHCMERDEPVVDEVVSIHGVPHLVSSHIVRMGGDVLDVIFTLQPVAAISELESKLRKSLHARGLTCQYSFADIWGESPALQKAIATARSFAGTDSPVLLTGETGTGKELFAQAIHQVSPWASGPFVAINCAALPPSLLESELFGHEEGAFTGARRNGKPGLFELAHNGTIFLDEVSEMDHYGQTRLLRVLQERCTMRIGGDRFLPVTARVIAASNRTLPDLVEQNLFRRDLFYRLNVLPLHLPPLRERQGDIALLARQFAEEYRRKYGVELRLTSTLMDVLERHPWPGNVRELSGIIERLVLLSRTEQLGWEQVEAALGHSTALDVLVGDVSPPLSGNPERDRILEALAKNKGHQGRAAQALGIHRSTLRRKMLSLRINLQRIPA